MARWMSEPILKAITLLLAACFVLAACHPTITHVDVYPTFGPHYGDGR
jgi:ABC-type uncharacterized transport system auxiliary subunit